MHQEEDDADDVELGDKRVCSACIGDNFLKAEVDAGSIVATCSYCMNEGKTISIVELADTFEKVFEDHYQRTASSPSSLEYIAHNDPESNYSWVRKGGPVADIIAIEAGVDQPIAEDVHELLADRYYDHEAAKMGEEGPFDGDVQYARKSPEDHELRETWSFFRSTLQTESRMFNKGAEAALGSIFDGIGGYVTQEGKPVIVDAGPGHPISSLFRARMFTPYADEIPSAIMRPDREIGPPPFKAAKAGRMNAQGISVFYGATNEMVAIAEIRPPVGSHVVVARFEITRPLRLLDVEALETIYVEGSVFDPSYVRRLEKAQFLERLSSEITIPVMPENEPLSYLVTQAIAEFLASRDNPAIDGIIYKSIQAGNNGINVALFHKSSCVEPLDFPYQTQITAHAGITGEDDAPSYMVWEETPETELPVERHDRYPFPDVPLAVWGGDVDSRAPALKLDPSSVTVHHIKGVSFTTYAFKVSRHRSKARKQKY